MDEVAKATNEWGLSIVTWGYIIALVMVLIIVTVFLLRKFPVQIKARSEDTTSSRKSSTRTDTTFGGHTLPAEFEAAATVGSDYYVPSSDEFEDAIKVKVFDRQKRDALKLSREMVAEYVRQVESGEAKKLSCIIANSLVNDYAVMKLCEEILQDRGWSASKFRDGTAFLSPRNVANNCSFSSIELDSIVESESLAGLIESKIFAPRKARALSVAKQLVDGYRLELEAGEQTNQGISVTLAKAIKGDDFKEVENILAPRGWSVYHHSGKTYRVWPDKKRDRPFDPHAVVF